MSKNEIVDDCKTTSWWSILKSLPFNGGASSTRWVYLCCFATVALALLSLVWSICWVYIRAHDHYVDKTLCILIGSTITALIGFATQTQAKKHVIDASLTKAGFPEASTPVPGVPTSSTTPAS